MKNKNLLNDSVLAKEVRFLGIINDGVYFLSSNIFCSFCSYLKYSYLLLRLTAVWFIRLLNLTVLMTSNFLLEMFEGALEIEVIVYWFEEKCGFKE